MPSIIPESPVPCEHAGMPCDVKSVALGITWFCHCECDACLTTDELAALHDDELFGPAEGEPEWATPPCPCCQRPLDTSLALCAECTAARCGDSPFATADLPYPYCAATDSSPLAES